MDEISSQTEAPGVALQYNVTGIRIIAGLVDVVVLAAVFLLMAAAFGDFGNTSNDESSSFRVSLTGGPFLLFLLISLAYFVLFEGLVAGTPGKLLLGLRVVKGDGSRCDWSNALVRNLVRLVDGLPAFYLVGLVSIAVTKKNQRLGNLAAGTLVVRSR